MPRGYTKYFKRPAYYARKAFIRIPRRLIKQLIIRARNRYRQIPLPTKSLIWKYKTSKGYFRNNPKITPPHGELEVEMPITPII